MTAPRGRGRRPGGVDTRAAIISAARGQFAAKGYDKASIRGIAREAGVDPALVHHYFADKPELFAAALELPIRPDRIVAELLAGPPEVLGTSIVRAIVTRFADPATRSGVLALLRTAMGHEFAGRMLRQFLLRELLQRITSGLGLEDGERRAAFAASQIVGLIVARYGIRIGPLAEASDDEVVATVGPVLQWYLTGDPPPARS